jgi:hypothetical protein
MKAKARLAHLSQRLSESQPSENRKSEEWEVHPPYGEKGDFRKLSVTLPKVLFAHVVEEATRRKVAGLENANTSAVIREALSAFFAQRSTV